MIARARLDSERHNVEAGVLGLMSSTRKPVALRHRTLNYA